MEIEVFDKEGSGKDKPMGKCKVDITDFISKGQFDGEIDLHDSSMKNVGRISISAMFDRIDNSSKKYNDKNIHSDNDINDVNKNDFNDNSNNNNNNNNNNNINNNNINNNSSSKSLYKVDKIPSATSYENQSTRNQLSVYKPQVQNNKGKNSEFRETQSGIYPPRDHSTTGKFSDDEILEAFVAFDLDKNNFIGAAEIRHVLINIGEQVRAFFITFFSIFIILIPLFVFMIFSMDTHFFLLLIFFFFLLIFFFFSSFFSSFFSFYFFSEHDYHFTFFSCLISFPEGH